LTPYLTEDEVRERLRRKVAELGSQQKLADIAGCSHTLVSRILTTGAPVGPRIAQALGLIAIPMRSYQYLPREDGAR
jgi:predicted transcriptional regulator